MNLKKYPVLFTAAATIALVANAVPARRGNYQVTQPDGTTLTIHKIGDESLHFTLTTDNMLVVEDDNGQYSYARVSDGAIVSTGIRALDADVRPASHANFVQSIDDVDIEALQSKSAVAKSKVRRTTAYQTLGKFTSNFPTKGSVKGLVILAQYSDKSFSSTSSLTNKYRGLTPNQYFTQMLNSKNFSLNGGTGSAKDYFEEMSMGQFTPTFDVYGPYTLPNTYKYYGANDQYGDDLHPGQLIMEVCKLADDDINYADYDFDGDGYVDNVYVFYAGTGEASSYVENDIWPHQYTLSEWNYYDKDVEPITCDGKIVDRYACSNEVTDGAPSGVGTFVHEFSHVMGLPDLYVTTGTDHNCTPGYFSVLDYGPYNNDGHTPPAYGAYERNAMGWIDLDEFDGSDTYTLENIATSNKAYVVETSREKEFYLFENRQLTGWDAYIPNHGMMIWHIDATSQQIFDNNIPNNNQSHQYVAVVKPNGEENMDYASGWTWPGTSGKTAFSSSTTPAFKDWKNVASEKALANIAETNGIISFDVTMPLPVPTPDAENLIKKGDDHFYASWKALKDATDYKLWVYTAKYPTDDEAVTVTADMGTGTTFKLPDGWSSSSGVAATSSYYGEAAPGAKFSTNGSYIQTPAYEYDVCGISFWYKGTNTGSTASISVQGLIDGAWKVLETISLADTEKHAGYTVSNIPNGVKQVRLMFNKATNGTLAIDDVVIVTKPTVKYDVLPGYDGVSTSGNNSVLVNNLVEGCDTYAFCVAATADGKNYTDASEIRAVNLGATSGVHGVAVDAAEGLRVSVNNRTVSVSTSVERVEVFNIVGHHISSVRVSDNSAVIDLPTSGMYIVRAGNSTAKVVVR